MHQERTGNFGTFLWAEGVKGAEIHTCLCAQYWEVLCPRDMSTSGYKCLRKGRQLYVVQSAKDAPHQPLMRN